MINQVYRLVEPRRIEISFQSISLDTDNVIVRPTYLSICAADHRYYMGIRSKEYLKRKLPMALIHEATGIVVYDRKGEFKPGEKVALIPNTPFHKDEFIAENYLPTSKFRASGFDGFMQEYVSMGRSRLVECNGINPVVASVTELISVAMHAVDTFLNRAHGRRETIGVWGDGNLGYVTALLLRYKSPNSKIIAVGRHYQKLKFFSFVDGIFHLDELPDEIMVDHAFECVGGPGAEFAIEQIIDHINPEGSILLLGVTENRVAIFTRMILEKGLTLIGRSRSGREDFVNAVNLLKTHKDFEQNVSKILNNVISVSNIKEISAAFELDIQTPFKTIMQWNV